MSDETAIEWTDHTFNVWWGCARVSPGCRFCYADSLANRWGHSLWRRHGERRMLSDQNWAKPLRWNRDAEQAGKPALVFCSSMADVFEEHPEPEVNVQLDAARARLWELIDQTPWLRWQLLTKRPQNVKAMVPWGDNWPTTVWLGTSVENQQYADERVPVLLDIPARIRFLSCEPLLGPIDLIGGVDGGCAAAGPAIVHYSVSYPVDYGTGVEYDCQHEVGIDWVICGGESGPEHRPMDLDWARYLRDQCERAGVPFLFKQHGGRTSKAGGRELDGRTHDGYPERVA